MVQNEQWLQPCTNSPPHGMLWGCSFQGPSRAHPCAPGPIPSVKPLAVAPARAGNTPLGSPNTLGSVLQNSVYGMKINIAASLERL